MRTMADFLSRIKWILAASGCILLLLALSMVISASSHLGWIVFLAIIGSVLVWLSIGRQRPKVMSAVILLIIFGVALYLRIWLPYDDVFGGDWVEFGGNDPWYHMRLVENLVQHFPFRIAFDTFTFYPYGLEFPFAPFFDLLLGFFVWSVGLGSPSQQTIETLGAYFPAILGALVTIPVYFIGRELFSRNVGLLSAGLIAILPGEFLFRSLLGFTDHHIAEVLFSAITVLFLILAIKSAKEKEISFSHIWSTGRGSNRKHLIYALLAGIALVISFFSWVGALLFVCILLVWSRDWGNLRKPLIYALLTGIALGVYLLSWVGGLLFVFIILAYILIQYVADHLRGKSTDYLCIIGVPLFLIALVMINPFPYPYPGKLFVVVPLVIGMLIPLVLSTVSWLMDYLNIKRAYYPLALAGLGLVGAVLFYFIEPSLFGSMLERFNIFLPSVTTRTIAEAQPLFSGFDISQLTKQPVWTYFTTGLFIVPLSLILITYAVVKEKSAEKTLLVIWCVIMLAAMVGQKRFAYYFAVNVALLSGYLCWKIPGWTSRTLAWFGFGEPSPADKKASRAERRRKARKRRGGEGEELGSVITRYLGPRYISAALAAVIVFFLAFYPNIGMARDVAAHPWGPNEDWHDSLVWMREHTPDPFEDPDFYYEFYEKPPSGEWDYPESAYGVMSWWDYGHWITRIAHRIPNANPFQRGIGGSLAGIADAGTKAILTNSSLSQQDDYWNGYILEMITGGNAGQFRTIVDFDAATDSLTVAPAFDEAISAGDEYVIIRQGASTFLTAQDEALANKVLDDLGSEYVIIDVEMSITKFHVMPTWAGKDQDEFFDMYYAATPEGQLEPIFLYHPAYYQSMCARLYNFGGEAAVPVNSTWAISYVERVDERGNTYKEITGVANEGLPFATYEEAQAFIADHPAYMIVGLDPFRSSVPLEKLEHYELIYQSDSIVVQRGDETISYVEIFEYIP